ncbi:hypothetical protein C1H46_011437 [Malus baccata]|uniref:HD-ZIP protein N-terminal domain-containing protein n=1 Tax=Malus baccata TaxID=106549 RepID=A0A540MX76_MALBA|nr:hypothetical protein C1H46_011437 [Malus baccata]
MMVEREDLGLSLSLNFPQTHNNHSNTTTSSSSFRLNLMPSLLPTSASSTSGFLPQKPLWNDSLPSSDLNSNSETYRAGPRSFLRGIDVNRLPSTVDCEDEAGVSSPNSTVSSVSGKRSERDANGEDLDLERDGSRGISDEEDGEACRKKLRLSKDQSAILEESFKEHNTLNPNKMEGRKEGRKDEEEEEEEEEEDLRIKEKCRERKVEGQWRGKLRREA